MAKRVDANQSQIVWALRAVGATVQSLASVGRGCPDLVVGFRGQNWLMEIKDGSRAPSGQRLTVAEARFHQEWRGQVAVVRDADEALVLIGAIEGVRA